MNIFLEVKNISIDVFAINILIRIKQTTRTHTNHTNICENFNLTHHGMETIFTLLFIWPGRQKMTFQ